MCDILSRLHDPNNSSLSLIMTIRSHSFVRLFVFLLGLFQLDLVDFDAVFFVLEIKIYSESVRLIDVLASRGFGEDAVSGAG